MYQRHEASKLRQEFWTSFGQYMKPVLSTDGERVNWINYKTGEKDIRFLMQADNKSAAISIELSHRDSGLRQLYFEQFLELKTLLHQELGEEWNWNLEAYDETGRQFSSISLGIKDVSIMKKEDWPRLIAFFKPRIIALDRFWSSARYSFEALR